MTTFFDTSVVYLFFYLFTHAYIFFHKTHVLPSYLKS